MRVATLHGASVVSSCVVRTNPLREGAVTALDRIVLGHKGMASAPESLPRGVPGRGGPAWEADHRW